MVVVLFIVYNDKEGMHSNNETEDEVAVMDFGYIRILGQEEKDSALKNKVLEMLEDERTLFVDIRNKEYTRPAYERMCDMIQPGDVIYIDELDSLGRTYEDMAAEWYRLTHDWTIDVVVLSDRIELDSREFRQLGEHGKRMQQLLLELLVYMAELQHRRVRDNQREGIEKARQAGRRFGRPRMVKDPVLMEKTAQRWAEGEISIDEVCAIVGGGRSTVYQYMKNHGYTRKKEE